MAPPSRPWFRFYTEAIRDPKLRRLPPTQRWVWVCVLAAARQSPLPGFLVLSDREVLTVADIADQAGVKEKEASAALASFQRFGMIELDTRLGAYQVTNWDSRQYESDDVTSRVRAYRERSKKPGCNVSSQDDVTPPESETETEVKTSSNGSSNAATVAVDDDLWKLFAERKHTATLRAGQSVTNPTSWKTAVAKNAATELADLAQDLLARFDLSRTQLVDVLLLGTVPTWAKRRA